MAEIVEAKTYADADGRRVEVIEMKLGMIHFAPEGGGMVSRIGAEAFHARFKEAPGAPPMKVFKVTGEWLDEGVCLEAYSDGRAWNGWATPAFTLEQGKKLASLMPTVSYDETSDRFLVRNEDYAPPDDVEYVEPETIEVDGQTMKVYPIGSHSWCWWAVEA